jgi:hypothetical protein
MATLADAGCSATDIVDVLELLLLYCSTGRFEKAKGRREKWLDRAKNLVLRLRRVAKDAEEILQFVANRPRKISVSKPPAPKPSSSPQVQSPIPGTDSDDDPSPQSPPSTAEIEDEYFRDVEPELWDVMRRHADDLEANLRMQMDENLPFAQPFARSMAGTTGTVPFLVLAAALVEVATGGFHYSEIATLIGVIRPQQRLQTEAALQKKVANFKSREKNKEFVDEWLEAESEAGAEPETNGEKVRKSVKMWLRSLQRSQSQ